MSRTIPSGVAADLTATQAYCALLCEMSFASGYLRLWTGVGNLTYDGNTWSGIGSLGGVSSPEETGDGSARGFTLTLSGCPSASISLALGEVYRGRPVKLWLGFFTSAWVMKDVVQLASGRMDTMTIAEAGETSTITVQCENRLIDLQRPREVRFTESEQNRRYPGDLGCSYVARIVERPIYWGVVKTEASPR